MKSVVSHDGLPVAGVGVLQRQKAQPHRGEYQFPGWYESLLTATLETWVHQLLFQCQVYPADTFGTSRFLGVICHYCRHPDVVAYIQETVRPVVVPGLLSGAADAFAFHVVRDRNDSEDTGTASSHDEALSLTQNAEKDRNSLEVGSDVVICDTYDLRLSIHQGNNIDDDYTNSHEIRSLTERSLRDMILSILSLGTIDVPNVQTSTNAMETLSFRLTLHIPEENRSCQALNQAFSDGSWLSTDVFRQQRIGGNGPPDGWSRRTQDQGETVPRSRPSPSAVIRPIHRSNTNPFNLIEVSRRRQKVVQPVETPMSPISEKLQRR
jgi:hypothetical protein